MEGTVRLTLTVIDGPEGLTTDFLFLVRDGLVSSIVLGHDWLVFCRDATSHDRRSIPSAETVDVLCYPSRLFESASRLCIMPGCSRDSDGTDAS